MRRSVGLMLVALLVATATTACGDTGGDDGAVATTTPTARSAQPPAARASDVTLAKRALVTLADVPDGWGQDGGTVTRIRCGAFDPYVDAGGVVTSPRLTHEHSGVQARIAVYATPTAAARGLRRLDSRIAARCLQRELRRKVSDEAGAPASPARLVRAEPLGRTANARRYISTSVSSYGKVVGYIDAVHMRVGRGLAAIVFVAGPTPPDESIHNVVVDRLSQRLRTTLG